MQGHQSISGSHPYNFQLTNPKATGKDHLRATKAALCFAGRTVANAAYSQLGLSFRTAGIIGGVIGGAVGGAKGLLQGCYHKAFHSGSKEAKRSLSDYAIENARTGYSKGDLVGRYTALATLPVLAPLAVLGGGIGMVIAATHAPVVYLQARDNSVGYSDMAEFINDIMDMPAEKLDDMSYYLQTGKSRRPHKKSDTQTLYTNIDLSYDPAFVHNETRAAGLDGDYFI